MKPQSTPFRVFAVFLSLTLVTGFVYFRSGGHVADLGLEAKAVAADRDAEITELRQRIAQLEQQLARLLAEKGRPAGNESVPVKPKAELMLDPKSAPVVLPDRPPTATDPPPATPAASPGKHSRVLLPGSKSRMVLEPQELPVAQPQQSVQPKPAQPPAKPAQSRTALPGSKSVILIEPSSVTPATSLEQSKAGAPPKQQARTTKSKAAAQTKQSSETQSKQLPTRLLPGSKSDGVFNPRDVKQSTGNSQPSASGYSTVPRP